jgi:ferredoxin-NADP reductase
VLTVKAPRGSDLERRLRVSAQAHRTGVADPELGAILSLVATRRGARQVSPGASNGPSPVASPVASAGASPGTVLASTSVGPDVTVLRLARPPGLTFRAGQALKLGVPGGPSRSYTIASSPQEALLEFCIERIAGGRVSPSLTSLSPGARVELGASPKGTLTLEPSAALHLMLATATGIAPFRSMLREAFAAKAPSARFLVIHGASYADRLPYAEELASLAAQHPGALRYVTTVSRPGEARNQQWRGTVGRVDTLLAAALKELAAGTQAYACGNSGMIAAVAALCSAHGIPLKSEAFD